MRLDQLLAAARPDLSRRKARSLITAGHVLVNRRVVRIASREVPEGAELTVLEADLPKPVVLAESKAWVAVNKPAGLPSQPTRTRTDVSLEDMVRSAYGEIYLVHRLDTPTSGVMLFARTARSAAELSRLFAGGAIRKVYLARVDPPLTEERTIEADIDGKTARTIVRPHGPDLVEVEIQTGRTHQIRIHLSGVGHPVRGDRRYGGKPASRLMLHAWSLSHPTLGTITAPPEL